MMMGVALAEMCRISPIFSDVLTCGWSDPMHLDAGRRKTPQLSAFLLMCIRADIDGVRKVLLQKSR